MFSAPFPDVKSRKKLKEKATKILFKSLTYSFAMFGLLFILLLFVLINFLRQDRVMFTPVPKEAVLTIDFDDVYTESRVDDLISELAEINAVSFYDLVKAINVAAMDDRIKAVVAEVSSSSLGLSQIQELRKSIGNFRASGKKAYIHSSGFGSFGGGMSEYYLAAAFDEIWMIPNTEVGITGIKMEVPFFRGILEKVGVEPEFYTRYEYKNAVASIMNKKFEGTHRKEMERLGGELFEQMVADIAFSRNFSEADVKKIVNYAPVDAKTALEGRLIDKIGFRPDVLRKATNEGKIETIDLSGYLTNFDESQGRKFPVVAFLAIDGVINRGESSSSVHSDSIAGSRTIADQIDEIAKEKNLKALVVRVNSPGGSYTASQEIWYSIMKLKTDKKIPVIVTMGDYAASGGYFVSLAGDRVFAENATITGSIGVLGGKFVLSGLWNKLGINWGEIKFGENAGILSMNSKFSKRELEIFNNSLDNIYKDFTSKVSGARGIDLDSLDKLARGRVWTGREALKNGLIDEIGGIDNAIAKAKEMSGIKSDERFRLAYYPRPKTIQEKIAEILKKKKGVGAGALLEEIGIGKAEFNALQRLKFDAILPPAVISY